VALFAFYGLDGAIVNIEGVRTYPGGLAHYGNDMMRGHAQHWGADLVISLMDTWVQENWGSKLRADGRAFAAWAPVDQTPVPQRVMDQLSQASVVLAMSRFGHGLLEEAGLQNVMYLPHAVSLDTYQPMDQAAARRATGLPEDAFIVGMVAANKGRPARKCFAEQMQAFARMRTRVDERCVLYLHCLSGTWDGGVDLAAMAGSLGLMQGVDVIFADPYRLMTGYPDADMAALYNSMDVLSAATMGEGFGIPTLEAQACGVPVVTSANTTGRELNWSGVVIEKLHPYWTDLNAWASMPDVDELAQAYLMLHEGTRGDREFVRRQAREGAKAYGVRTVAEKYLAPALASIAEGIAEGWI
jgi:glycosyltransferase involved in cell wall biosynthesis